MDAIKNVLSPLAMGTGALQDTVKLVVIGGTVETARRLSVSAWNGFIDSFFLTAHFNEEDYPYDWIMHWLGKQAAWHRTREFEITTRSVSRHGLNQSTMGDLEDPEEEDTAFCHGRKQRRVAFLPSLDTTHTIYYRGHWLRITRTKRYPEYGRGTSLKISVVARSNDIIKKLVLQAKREYEKDAEHRVHIFLADTTYGCWRWNGARHKRPMSSIVLEPGVKDMLLNDCRDFLNSEDWYAERGIPFRRGYLLYGVPGSGKTSLIHSLAGELGLDIYVVSLSSKGMSDNTLTTLMGYVPSRCILLLEDLDAAFTRGVSRDASSTGVPITNTNITNGNANDTNDGSTLSLSGLLNSLDGVAAAEGRLLFATTNHIERLDPALSRPGRMDVWVNFTHATKWQAEGIFKCFFPSKPSATLSAANASATEKDSSQKNLPGLKKKATTHSVPLLDEEEISELAKRFAGAIPENEMSVASLQGYLLKNKTRPRECVDEVAEWVVKERETQEKLKKEKAEREAKEKKDTEEKEKKEDDKAPKDKEEKDVKEKKDGRKTKRVQRVDTTTKTELGAVAGITRESTSTQVPTPPVTELSQSESDTAPSEGSTGIDADSEGSITSEDDSDKSPDGNAPESQTTKDKWVSVKGQAVQTAP